MVMGRLLANVGRLFIYGPAALAGGAAISLGWPEWTPLGPLLIFVAGMQLIWWFVSQKTPTRD